MADQSPQGSPDVPSWVKDAIFYQIFPDRFASCPILAKPNNLLSWEAPPSPTGYHGGDLLGILDHLDHLVDLGVNAIYLNPIFQSTCNHRYHTHDYLKVDPLLGGDGALRSLVETCHQLGIRIILDGVFNHASRGFYQFNDILENGPDSPWLDWFLVEDWPLAPYDEGKPANYASWWGLRALPKFNTDNSQVREFIMQVAEYWIREFDIDGWRLDVPEEIKTAGFWEEFRLRVKRIKPEVYLLGEIWGDANEWLLGNRFDAVMNYPFAAAVIAFTAGDRVSPSLIAGRAYNPYPPVNTPDFGVRIQRLLNSYDWQVTQVQYNLLDSHDTARLISLSRGDKATIRLATLIQMTFPGAPAIYYGDEIGLRGTEAYDDPHRDADARWTFPWQDKGSWDFALLDYFKDAITLRRDHPVLRHGRFVQLFAEGNCYSFARSSQTETLIVVLNVGETANQILLPVGTFFDEGTMLESIFGEGICHDVTGDLLKVDLPARTGTVLARRQI